MVEKIRAFSVLVIIPCAYTRILSLQGSFSVVPKLFIVDSLFSNHTQTKFPIYNSQISQLLYFTFIYEPFTIIAKLIMLGRLEDKPGIAIFISDVCFRPPPSLFNVEFPTNSQSKLKIDRGEGRNVKARQNFINFQEIWR